MSTTAVPLNELSHAQKLCLMEELWDALTHSPEGVPSPEWHGEILAERRALVERGEAEWLEWDEVKAWLLQPRK